MLDLIRGGDIGRNIRVSSEWVRLFRIPLGEGQVYSGVEEIGVNLSGVDMIGQNFLRNK